MTEFCCRSIIENLFTGSIMVRFGNMIYDNWNSLSRVIRSARRLTGVDLREFCLMSHDIPILNNYS